MPNITNPNIGAPRNIVNEVCLRTTASGTIAAGAREIGFLNTGDNGAEAYLISSSQLARDGALTNGAVPIGTSCNLSHKDGITTYPEYTFDAMGNVVCIRVIY